MPDSAIRTTRGAGGPRSLKVVHFETLSQPDGSFVVQDSGGLGISGKGRTPELALEAAQAAQAGVMTNDAMPGKGFRQVTAKDMGIVE